MDRAGLEAGARKILLGNLRRGRADWNGKEFNFVCPALKGYPFQWYWDSCFHAIALIHLDIELAKAELTTLMSAGPAFGIHTSPDLLGAGKAGRLPQPQPGGPYLALL